MISIFAAIKLNPTFHAKRSADWFREKIKELANAAPIKEQDLMKTTKAFQSAKLLPSTMVFFSYDPKHKETLPYYDKFPLSFITQIDAKGFTGINFHYLSQPMRIKLFDAMYNIAAQSHMPSQQVLQLNWQLLSNASRFPAVVPAVKRYLWGHVRSKFIKVPIEDWKTAIMLENSQFKKVSTNNVRTISSRIAAQAMQRSN